jgi:hypothetical protein
MKNTPYAPKSIYKFQITFIATQPTSHNIQRIYINQWRPRRPKISNEFYNDDHSITDADKPKIVEFGFEDEIDGSGILELLRDTFPKTNFEITIRHNPRPPFYFY